MGWSHSFSIKLEINGATVLTRRGRGYVFTGNAGPWDGDTDNPYQLFTVGTRYTLTRADEAVETCNSLGQLTQVDDLAGSLGLRIIRRNRNFW